MASWPKSRVGWYFGKLNTLWLVKLKGVSKPANVKFLFDLSSTSHPALGIELENCYWHRESRLCQKEILDTSEEILQKLSQSISIRQQDPKNCLLMMMHGALSKKAWQNHTWACYRIREMYVSKYSGRLKGVSKPAKDKTQKLLRESIV